MDLVDLVGIGFSLCVMLSMGLVMLIPVAILGSMLGLPFVFQSKWKRWTSGTAAEAWENVAEGASRGPIQIVPASYLWERTVEVDLAPADAIAAIEAYYRKMPLITILGSDDTGVMVDVRIPSGLGPGWIAVFKVEPGEDGGSRVHDRHRSTFCIAFPVLTLFLGMSLHLHQERIIRQACARS